MVEYDTVNAKLSNSQLNKLKSAVKNRQGTTLRMSAKTIGARQTTKLRNVIENNISTDIKLSIKLKYLK